MNAGPSADPPSASRLFISGVGAVSPAGWSVADLRAALQGAAPLPVQRLERPGWERSLAVRMVPAPMARFPWMTHPRLRRVSPLSQYAVAAGLEAAAAVRQANPQARFGVLFCVQSGPVQYASRFYQETLQDPATASPMLFPETVFAAPASHVAALLGNVSVASSLLGDPGTFLTALVVGGQWLAQGLADAVLVIGGEEFNWLQADAAWHFDHQAILGAGAGAVCLTSRPLSAAAVEIEAITDVHTYSRRRGVADSAAAMRRQLPPGGDGELLCDSVGGTKRLDRAEQAAWRDWPGATLSPKSILGDGFMAGAAWQCVAAADAVAQGRFRAAHLSIVGCNQQAIGARLKPA